MFMESSKKHLINFKAYVRSILPYPIILALERLRSIPDYLRWKYDLKKGYNAFLSSTQNLKGKYKNKRCIIIGNGPSLNKVNLQLLKNEYTFGLNRVYLLFEKMGFQTDFLVSINRYVIQQFHNEMSATKCKKFYHYRYRNSINSNNVTFIPQTIYGLDKFDKVDKGFISYSGSVTFLAIQLAIYFGFSQIILVGFDNNFNTKGRSDKAVTSSGDDTDHFDKNYFGQGVIWQLPNYDALDFGFKTVKNYFNKNTDKEIINCTVGGNLYYFQREKLEKILNESKYGNKEEN
tara:strand:+ start:2192 stop:3061 length:870 start_codon:yes stop_codon:yes gene_type:complete